MSLETQEVVNPVDSATTEAVNDQTAETTAPESTATTETTTQTQEATTIGTPTATTSLNADLYDERGVPYKNVAMEYRRKYEETQQNLPKLIAEEIAKTTQQQKPKYTVAELEDFAQKNPEHRAWVEQEKMNLLKADLSQDFTQRIEATTRKQQEEVIRTQVFNKVLSTFPEIAFRDQSGNFLGWNNTNPMTQAIGKYMSSPDLASRPDGLEIASKLAYADTMLAKTPQTQKQIQALKSQVKKVQQQTLLEGGGRKLSEGASPTKTYIDRVAKTGRAEDAAGVFREIHKKMGMTKE